MKRGVVDIRPIPPIVIKLSSYGLWFMFCLVCGRKFSLEGDYFYGKLIKYRFWNVVVTSLALMMLIVLGMLFVFEGNFRSLICFRFVSLVGRNRKVYDQLISTYDIYS